MSRIFKDTIFLRLFGLVLVAIVISHLTTFALLAGFYGGGRSQHSLQTSVMSVPQPPAKDGMFKLRTPPPPPPPPPGMWIGLLTQFIALSLAAWFGARILVRPIQRLGNAAAQLGNTFNSPLIEDEGPVEARNAARGFNQMQARVRAHIEERSRFLAAVSHDLRTPLTRMKLRMERPDEAIHRDRLLGDINEMTEMLNATLEYFRNEASLEATQLLDVQALVESIAEDAVDTGQDVSVLGTAVALPTLPMALRRCILNLLENALRYGECALIFLSDSADALLIEIRDNGPGIPPDKLQAVFEPFVRLEVSRNKSTGGVGLGLAIAKEAARQCGGKLSLRNAESGGLVAAVLIPRK